MFILIFLILFTAILSASETALFSLSQFTVREYSCSKDVRKQKIAKLLASPGNLLVSILMLNILANLLIQNSFSNLFKNFTSWTLKVGVPLVVVLFLGEVIPKSVAIANNRQIAYRATPIITVLYKVLCPLRVIFTYITGYISRFFFFFLKKEKPLSVDEVRHIVHESKRTGVLTEDEREFVDGYLELHSLSVKEVMKPKSEIIGFDILDPISKIKDIFSTSKYSRIPIFRGGVDNVIGILDVKTFFFNQERIEKGLFLEKFLKRPFFVPESTNSWELLHKLREREEDIAVVVDEYGSVAGIVTQEDLLGEIVGEIEDFREAGEDYTRFSNDVIIANGSLELDILEDIFGVSIKSDVSMVTLGGWLVEQMEEIPSAGEKFVTDEFLFYILEADPKMIKRVYVRRLKR